MACAMPGAAGLAIILLAAGRQVVTMQGSDLRGQNNRNLGHQKERAYEEAH
jgi:hypothetical protein